MTQQRTSLSIQSLVRKFSPKTGFSPSVMYLPRLDQARFFLADDSFTLFSVNQDFDVHRGNVKQKGKIVGCSINNARALFRTAGYAVPEYTTLGRLGDILIKTQDLGRYESWFSRTLRAYGRIRIHLKLT